MDRTCDWNGNLEPRAGWGRASWGRGLMAFLQAKKPLTPSPLAPPAPLVLRPSLAL